MIIYDEINLYEYICIYIYIYAFTTCRRVYSGGRHIPCLGWGGPGPGPGPGLPAGEASKNPKVQALVITMMDCFFPTQCLDLKVRNCLVVEGSMQDCQDLGSPVLSPRA